MKHSIKETLYVEFVEAVPWNSDILGNYRRCKGVGAALIGRAIELSIAKGYGGFFGLHSLPNSEDLLQEVENKESWDGQKWLEIF